MKIRQDSGFGSILMKGMLQTNAHARTHCVCSAMKEKCNFVDKLSNVRPVNYISDPWTSGTDTYLCNLSSMVKNKEDRDLLIELRPHLLMIFLTAHSKSHRWGWILLEEHKYPKRPCNWSKLDLSTYYAKESLTPDPKWGGGGGTPCGHLRINNFQRYRLW